MGATLDDGDTVSWEWTTDVSKLLRSDADAVAIDIPIGLPDSGTRTCDREARAMLGRRRSSVFAAPVRAVLPCATYADARGVLAALGGASMSAQAFGIVAAVRATDAVMSPADEHRVVEAHPELAFRRLAGADLDSKKTPPGIAQRVAALTTVFPGAADLVTAAPAPAARDDALDALACAWVARRWLRGEAVVLGNGERDARGLLMRIVA